MTPIPPRMTAIGSFAAKPIDDDEALQDVTVEVPELRPRDVLVRVLAVSVNPADVKVRAGLQPSSTPAILGYDAAGIVEAVGPQVETLSDGDEVWYAGDRVIATASRDESRAWAERMGADAVINHHNLRDEALAVAPDGVDYLFSPHSQGHIGDYAAIVDDGVLRTTVTKTIGEFSAAGLREAHRDVETGRMTGKVVVTR